MKVLLIAFAFPPYNSSGAVRVGKFARYLLDQGHDVRVLTARGLVYPANLKSEVPDSIVTATPWLNVNAPLEAMRRRMSAGNGKTGGAAASPRGWRKRLVDLYRALINLPDGEVGWLPWALAAGRRLLRDWRPDVIYASALPFSGHLVAASLARRAGCPWIAEFRDLFTDNPYIDRLSWRLPIDRWIERRVLANAAGTVTVSEPLADSLRRSHGKPGLVLLNGYDPADFAAIGAVEPFSADEITILYAGIIYAGRRDPAPLFAAMAQLGDLRRHVRVVFRGQDLRGVDDQAHRHGVEDRVSILPPLSYRDILVEQLRADILLLLMWNDPREVGVYTGKLFEYVGAGRPILTIGCDNGVAAQLVRDRGLGFSSSNETQIAAQLRLWIEEKLRTGRLASPPAAAKAGLSRAEQFAKAEAFMQQLMEGRGAS